MPILSRVAQYFNKNPIYVLASVLASVCLLLILVALFTHFSGFFEISIDKYGFRFVFQGA